jgi:hypothetical protein
MVVTYILDGREPKPIENVREWNLWCNTADQQVRQVAVTEDGDATVSTVFSGLDLSFGRGPPLIFETLVFGGEMDGEMDRYSTWEEAEHGHAIMVDRVKASR